MKTIRALLVDDERDSLDALALMLESFCTGIEVVAEAQGVTAGLEQIQESKPDLIFLDIEMKDGNGFDLLTAASEAGYSGFKVIFVTGYDQYAVKAFKYLAIDYLLKPVDPDDLQEAVQRVEKALMYESLQAQVYDQIRNNKSPDRIVIPGSSKHKVLRFEEITEISANGNYVFFKLVDGSQHLASHTLLYYEKWLPQEVFFRTHKSHIINLNHLKDLDSGSSGSITMSNNTQVPISVRKRPQLMKVLKQRSAGV